MLWNIITWKNGKRRSHIFKTKKGATCFDVANEFSLRYNGDKGEVLEIIPLDI